MGDRGAHLQRLLPVLVAVSAPVMMVVEAGVEVPVARCVPFGAWLRQPDLLRRAATRADLDHHLTTLCPPLAGAGVDVPAAARHGLADAALCDAVRACTAIAARHAPPGLEPDLASLPELATDGRCVGQELRARAAADGPLRLLEEEARA